MAPDASPATSDHRRARLIAVGGGVVVVVLVLVGVFLTARTPSPERRVRVEYRATAQTADQCANPGSAQVWVFVGNAVGSVARADGSTWDRREGTYTLFADERAPRALFTTDDGSTIEMFPNPNLC